MKSALSAFIGAVAIIVACSASITAQWPKYPEAGIPRDDKGERRSWTRQRRAPRTASPISRACGCAPTAVRREARAAADVRVRAVEPRAAAQQRAPQPAPAEGRQGAAGGGGDTNSAFGGGRGGVQLEPPTDGFPFDPKGPPVATFFEAGGNIEGGLPYTDWSREIRKQRFDVDKAKDNPDANCMPMGFLQFHQQPQPRKIIQTKQMILIEYEANYGIRHIYLDGRKLPPQGEPQPWWYGYSVGTWDGDTLVVETNNLRGAEDGPWDGWLDVNGSPYSREAKFTERIRRPKFGQLQIDTTLEDSKAYTKPWTVRIDQRYLADQELIEFVCNENQQFRRRIKID